MLHILRRHPFPVRALFRHCLVLTYAVPREILEPLLPPALVVDSWRQWGFVAIALVQTEQLRPSFLPARLGQRFFLSGYRVFARYTANDGRRRRGLRILRSDTDNLLMKVAGNILTHYNYRKAAVDVTAAATSLQIDIRTPDREADLSVIADLSSAPAQLPADSVFPDMAAARRYAGPLPFTFDYEPQTDSIIMIEGVRSKWNPAPVSVDVRECSFFRARAFHGVAPRLSNAFYIRDLPYEWRPGRRERLQRTASA